jgi:hypothetical protein
MSFGTGRSPNAWGMILVRTPCLAKQALQEIRRPDHLAVLEWKPQVGDTGVEIIQEATDGRG